MKLAIIGYGKMGREIERVALERNHTILVRIDNPKDWETGSSELGNCDAALEFSTPGTVVENLRRCFVAGVPVVTGTTGWNDKLEELKAECLNHNGTLFHASNFSIGVNLFFDINRRLARLMEPLQEYDVRIEEIHHVQKLDAPSGTAITLANDILDVNKRKSSWILGTASGEDQMSITSVREGTVPGTHRVEWDSDTDTITLKHEAKSRRGFAVGAVAAAEFIAGKKGIYGMRDLLNL
jgi:4-hydroxy-tetrahydrodipicolinate reductase